MTVVSSVKKTNLAQFFACDFQIHKKAYPQIQNFFTYTPKHYHDPLHNKKDNYIKITLKKYTYRPENTLMTPFHTYNF